MDRRMPSITKIVGIIILSMGILLAAWILYTIYQLIQGEGTSSIVTRILDIGAIDKTITISSETIILPESFFYILGVLILVSLLSICAGLSKVLISSGVQMLKPDYTDTLKERRKETKKKEEKRLKTN
jgi:hypothetical protein